MDFLNKSIAQVSELFRSMTPGARITAGLLLAVVVVSLGYLFRQGASGPDAYLFGGEPLSARQLDLVEAAIAEAKLTGAVREGNRIRVPAGQQAAYVAAVADGDALPPNFNTILENALGKAGPWESSAATRERMKIARQQTLSEIVKAMNWVEDAVVLYHEQETRTGRSVGATQRKTASVSVKPAVGETLDPVRVKNLQKLVSHAVNMNITDVNVTNLADGGLYGSDPSARFPDLIEDEFLKTKVVFELQKRESILGALRDIPGVRVEVNAEFDKTVEETQRDVRPDKTNIAATFEIETKDTSTQTTVKNGGPPGTTSMGPMRGPSAAVAGQENVNKTESTTGERTNLVSVVENVVSKRGYAPKEVWATVTLPRNYIVEVWKQRNPTSQEAPKQDELTAVENQVVTNVKQIVEPLLKLQATKLEDTFKHVEVVVLDSMPVAAIEPPSMASQAIAWTGQYWSTVAMLGVAMFSLLVLRSVATTAPKGNDGSPVAAPSLTLHAEEPATRSAAGGGGGGGAGGEDAADDRPRLRLKKSKSLKDDLVEIVKEDPDAAADILRSWIGKAG